MVRGIVSKFGMVIVLGKLEDHMQCFLPGTVHKLRLATKNAYISVFLSKVIEFCQKKVKISHCGKRCFLFDRQSPNKKKSLQSNKRTCRRQRKLYNLKTVYKKLSIKNPNKKLHSKAMKEKIQKAKN
jgi:hypothetical protein